MKQPIVLSYKFVQAIPNELEERTLYISMDYATAIHKCCCGCGKEVVTPFSPTDWKLIYNGMSVSLSPSIGNWSFGCRSHYWIIENTVEWAKSWSQKKVQTARAYDREIKQKYYDRTNPKQPTPDKARHGVWFRLRKWFSN